MKKENKNNKKFGVIGGGLVGSLLAIFLKRRGIDATVFEKRGDMRRDDVDGGRSINLIITSRAIHALSRLGLWDELKEITVPVFGRMMHSLEGDLTFQPYGKDKSECNYSVSRSLLNKALISIAEKEGVKFHFNRALKNCDFERNIYTFQSGNHEEENHEIDHIFATDGAGSLCRKQMMGYLKKSFPEKFDSSEFCEKVDLLESGYKEFFVPSNSSGNYVMDKDSLHIWPRGSFMFMTLANLKGSFTGTLYLPKDSSSGKPNFAELKNKDDVKGFFQNYFSDTLDVLPDLEEEFFANPVGTLGTVKCYPWNLQDKVLLVGDAAHAIVPFFGQGMNCGFEDCTVLDDLISQNQNDWKSTFHQFSDERVAHSNAIADMALENFHEMKDKVGDPKFLLKKQIENKLEQTFSNLYRSRYAMVTYSLIGYAHAYKLGIIQSNLIDELSTGLTSKDQLDLSKAQRLIEERIRPYLEKNKISFNF